MARHPKHTAPLDMPTPTPLPSVSTRVDTGAKRATQGQTTPGEGGRGSISVSAGSPFLVSPSASEFSQKNTAHSYLNQSPTGSDEGPVYASNLPPLPPIMSEVGDDDGTIHIEAGRYAYESLIALARHDVNTFNEFVLKDEETGEAIEQELMHVEMQRTYDKERFMICMAHPESGKTQQLVVGRTLHELGNDPTERHVFLNNGQDGSIKNLRAVKKYIERSEELRAVFPKLRPGNLWREDSIVVEGAGLSKDPSIYCLGFHGNITGARIDRAKVDDLLDFENTRTATSRADGISWFKRTFLTRLTRRATLAFLTNAWHEEDLAHTLEDEGWATLRYPVLNAKGKSTWPGRWDLARIAEWRKRLGPLEFARMFLCEPRDPGAVAFQPEWLRTALRKGVGYGFADQVLEAPSGALIVTGCDLGASKRMSGGETTMMTLCVHANGMRQLVAARAGRWSGGALMHNLTDVADRFGGVVVVEDNGIQKHIVDLANEEGIHISVPVLPFYTGRNKYDLVLGIDAMATEFEAGRWMLPSGRSGKGQDVPENVRKLLSNMRAYTPGSHPGDYLMGAWFARTWALKKLRQLQAGDRGARVGVRTIGG